MISRRDRWGGFGWRRYDCIWWGRVLPFWGSWVLWVVVRLLVERCFAILVWCLWWVWILLWDLRVRLILLWFCLIFLGWRDTSLNFRLLFCWRVHDVFFLGVRVDLSWFLPFLWDRRSFWAFFTFLSVFLFVLCIWVVVSGCCWTCLYGWIDFIGCFRSGWWCFLVWIPWICCICRGFFSFGWSVSIRSGICFRFGWLVTISWEERRKEGRVGPRNLCLLTARDSFDWDIIIDWLCSKRGLSRKK